MLTSFSVNTKKLALFSFICNNQKCRVNQGVILQPNEVEKKIKKTFKFFLQSLYIGKVNIQAPPNKINMIAYCDHTDWESPE